MYENYRYLIKDCDSCIYIHYYEGCCIVKHKLGSYCMENIPEVI
jgi:hypothetical protein